jgi:F420-dependent oxidoreductase-like protein
MTATTPIRFDIKTAPQFVSYEDMLRVWQEADGLPSIGGAWLFDHFMPLGPDQTGPILEGWTLLAAYAGQTKRLRAGVMVTGNTCRHPAVLANMATTVDVISGGRLDFGIGAGWFEFEHTAFGIPLYAPGERILRLGEACEVIRRMWTETAPDFDGNYYHLEHAYCEPKPIQKPYPPIVIGGGGERRTLRVVAQYADIWNYPGGNVEGFRHKSEVLDQHCAAIGRDPSKIVRSVQIFFNYENPQATRDEANSFIEAGARHIVLNLRPPYPQQIVHRVAEEIAEPLQAELAAL